MINGSVCDAIEWIPPNAIAYLLFILLICIYSVCDAVQHVWMYWLRTHAQAHAHTLNPVFDVVTFDLLAKPFALVNTNTAIALWRRIVYNTLHTEWQMVNRHQYYDKWMNSMLLVYSVQYILLFTHNLIIMIVTIKCTLSLVKYM